MGPAARMPGTAPLSDTKLDKGVVWPAAPTAPGEYLAVGPEGQIIGGATFTVADDGLTITQVWKVGDLTAPHWLGIVQTNGAGLKRGPSYAVRCTLNRFAAAGRQDLRDERMRREGATEALTSLLER